MKDFLYSLYDADFTAYMENKMFQIATNYN